MPKQPQPLTPEERRKWIEKLAYARYEKTGNSDAFVNWLWAERIVDGRGFRYNLSFFTEDET